MYTPIHKAFYERHPTEVARDLLGALLVRKVNNEVLVGRIVETEAYGGRDDPASHAYRGNKGRASVMFGEVGRAYVYFTYGNHYCLNVVARSFYEEAGAVLIRALEPLQGLSTMIKNRGLSDPLNLTNGPGKLTKAFAIDLRFNGIDLTKRADLFIAKGKLRPSEKIATSTRIGIKDAKDREWRFFVANNPYVSTLREPLVR
ncbi:3-methyladenine DNA glycosylase [Candidatus Marsarchaeota G2 archaeon ECH_B_SAG-F08]|uniref:Putative 3-methyladenine DNA glycosylase n=5 Tax=Candidatus Marsarchaeota TaxID=1978152 RepID=A0A2R6AGS7_9ARCH|nr:MAG: 3-methyladenine DNA glycosylase [Candidatus Marsarchaeota G1 archaeon OSP_D]PSN85602.1 MAG: 3-methyladenine DNA glycosylase [Candidatus Marsarchaeota G1 archaeon BE_D]PSN89490.1 MAG: 3-methyladenine DNA glycosylase [Candidatus Marsarchaeota G1 archaeon OSP_C]PSO00389.1 MAG: 3-methyladenine DNA glycosylase [Candidatus Marsarchaeota G2 archaeon ECH_B_SAG-F08]